MVKFRIDEFIAAMIHFKTMSRAPGSRRKATDTATLRGVDGGIEIDMPGGGTFVECKGRHDFAKAVIGMDDLAALNAGLQRFDDHETLAMLSINDGKLVLLCEALRAEYPVVGG